MKNQSLFQIVNTMKHFGVGQKVARSIWHVPNTYWEITRVELKEGKPSYGKAYGIFHWKGQAKSPKEEEVRSPLKKQWRLWDPSIGVAAEGGRERAGAHDTASSSSSSS